MSMYLRGVAMLHLRQVRRGMINRHLWRMFILGPLIGNPIVIFMRWYVHYLDEIKSGFAGIHTK